MPPTTITTKSGISTSPSNLLLRFGNVRIRTLQQELSTHGLQSALQVYTTQLRNLTTSHVARHVRRVRQRGYTRGSQVVLSKHHTRHLHCNTLQMVVRCFCEMVRDFVSRELPIFRIHLQTYLTLTFQLPTTQQQDNLNAPAHGGRPIYPQVSYNLQYVNGFELHAHNQRYTIQGNPFHIMHIFLRNHPSTEDNTELNFDQVVPFRH